MDLKYLKKFLEILYVFYSDSYFSFFQSASIHGSNIKVISQKPSNRFWA